MQHPTTVFDFVDALTHSYFDALENYLGWRKSILHRNHYHRRPRPPTATTFSITISSPSTAGCALAASLSMAGQQIRQTYDYGSGVIGSQFSTGNAACRDALRTQLITLQHAATLLRNAASSSAGSPLDIAYFLSISESVRRRSVRALAEQYRRLAVGRPVVKELPVLKPGRTRDQTLSSSPAPAPASDDEGDQVDVDDLNDGSVSEIDNDNDDIVDTVSVAPSAQSSLNSHPEPPSPPITPSDFSHHHIRDSDSHPHTNMDDDYHDDYNDYHHDHENHHDLTPPLVVETSILAAFFCPEAMALQSDPAKPVPLASRCATCGYGWHPLLPHKRAVLLKDGFRMSTRFLAKSHSNRGVGYACVLCLSKGLSDTYDSAERLGVHVNSSHSKWQMLRDRDMA